MPYQLTSPVELPSELAAGVVGVVLLGSSLAEHRVEVEEDAGLAGRRVDAIDHARPVDRVGCSRRHRGRSRRQPLPKTPPGPAAILTMSPPNDEFECQLGHRGDRRGRVGIVSPPCSP